MNHHEHKKLCLARDIHKYEYIDALRKDKSTWRQWWFKNYGESYSDYVEAMKREKLQKS